MDGNLTPLQRFFLAFVAFFYVLFNRHFAEEVKLLRDRERAALPPGPDGTPAGSSERASRATIAVPIPPPAEPAPPVAVKGPVAVKPAPEAKVPAEVKPAPAEVKAAEARPAPAEVKPTPAEAKAAAKLEPVPVPPPAPKPEGPSSEVVAMHVLGILQRDGRLIDFLSEDLNGFTDSEIGAAARTVHEGCRKTLDSYVTLEPVFREPEGATVTVSPGFDPATIRLSGNVVGAPPFKGSLRHHGWRALRAAFPAIPPNHDPRILAPAEVEL